MCPKSHTMPIRRSRAAAGQPAAFRRFLDEPVRLDVRRGRLYPFKARTGSPIGKPVVTIGDGLGLLAHLADWLGRRSNVVTDDFVDRLAGRAGMEEVYHCGSNSARLGWRAARLVVARPIGEQTNAPYSWSDVGD